MRRFFILFTVLYAQTENDEEERGKSPNKSDTSPPIVPDSDPLVDRFEKIERKVVAWNDRFGMDPSRKDRITRKISNTMKQLIEKSRKAAASDCRKVKNKKEAAIEFRNQAVTKIQEIKSSYKNVADEYLKDCKQYEKILRLSSVLQKRLTKSYRRAVRKEAAQLVAEKKEEEKTNKDENKNLKKEAQDKIKAQKKADREMKKENKAQAQKERETAKNDKNSAKEARDDAKNDQKVTETARQFKQKKKKN